MRNRPLLRLEFSDPETGYAAYYVYSFQEAEGMLGYYRGSYKVATLSTASTGRIRWRKHYNQETKSWYKVYVPKDSFTSSYRATPTL